MITSHQEGNTSFSNFPIRAPLRTPRCFGWGRVSKGSGFCIYVLLLFCASPFCDVQWLAGFPFYKVVILNSLHFKNLDLFLHAKFLCVLPSPWFEKIEKEKKKNKNYNAFP